MDAATLTALAELTVGDALGRLPLATQAFVGVLLVVTAAWTAARPGRTRAVAFVASALVWARANQGLEGFVLWTLSPEHGLTVADLLPPALLALVLARRAELARAARRVAAGCGRHPHRLKGRHVPANEQLGVLGGVGLISAAVIPTNSWPMTVDGRRIQHSSATLDLAAGG